MNKPRRMAIVLVASLALNLFLGGLLVGRFLFHGHGRGHADFGPAMLFGAEGVLGDKAEPAIREVFRKHERELRPELQANRKARDRVAEAFRREPFDPAALKDALGELRRRNAESQVALHEALVDLASQLTPEQRAKLLDANPKMFRRGHRRPPGPNGPPHDRPNRPDGPPPGDAP